MDIQIGVFLHDILTCLLPGEHEIRIEYYFFPSSSPNTTLSKP